MRMYGGTKAPSLLPKYATDYIVHKEAMGWLFLDGFGSYLFDLKNDFFPQVPFYVGSYKFSKFNSAPKLLKELEIFHFSEKSFHMNYPQGKVEAHHALLKVNFEYADYVDKDEEMYRNLCYLTALNKRLRRKITISGGKDSSRNNPK